MRYKPIQVRLSVIVIPRCDAESRKHKEHSMKLIAYTGFRVAARNDKYQQTI